MLLDGQKAFGQEDGDSEIREQENRDWKFFWENETVCDENNCVQSQRGCGACASTRHWTSKCPARRLGPLGWRLVSQAQRLVPWAHICTWDQRRELTQARIIEHESGTELDPDQDTDWDSQVDRPVRLDTGFVWNVQRKRPLRSDLYCWHGIRWHDWKGVSWEKKENLTEFILKHGE